MNTNRLKELRDKKNIKGPEIAKVLNITPQYYYELEKGEKRLNETLLRKFAEFYNVTTDYILKIDNNNDTRNNAHAATGLSRPGYIDEGVPQEVADEIMRYAQYVIGLYKSGKYKSPRFKE
jgi:transcriptional regulator with XRE-family HTH domain